MAIAQMYCQRGFCATRGSEYGSINSLAGRTAWLALRRNDSTAHSRMKTYGDCESVL